MNAILGASSPNKVTFGLNPLVIVFILSYQNLEVGLYAEIETPNLVQRGMHIRLGFNPPDKI